MSDRLDDGATRYPSQLQADLAQADPDPAPQPEHQEPPEPAQPSPEEVIADLRKQLGERDAERRRLERERNDALQQREQARGREQDAYGASLQAAAEAQQTRIAQAKEAIKQAMAAQDFDALLSAQDAYTDAKVSLGQLDADKRRHEGQKQAPQSREAPASGEQARSQVSSSAQAWIDAHPRFTSDTDYYDAAILAHNRAVRDGIQPDTTAYYRFLDERLAKMFPDPPSAAAQPAPKPQSKVPASSMAAPSSRLGASPGPRGGNDAAAVAQKLGTTVDELRTGARICNMEFDRYVKLQAEIMEDARSGRPTGLVHEPGMMR